MTKEDQTNEEQRFVRLINLADRDAPGVDAERLSRSRNESLAAFVGAGNGVPRKTTSNAKRRASMRRRMLAAAVGLLVVAGIALWPSGPPNVFTVCSCARIQ